MTTEDRQLTSDDCFLKTVNWRLTDDYLISNDEFRLSTDNWILPTDELRLSILEQIFPQQKILKIWKFNRECMSKDCRLSTNQLKPKDDISWHHKTATLSFNQTQTSPFRGTDLVWILKRFANMHPCQESAIVSRSGPTPAFGGPGSGNK